MKKVAVLFHDGFEEVEALSVVDIMRRANVECTMVGMDKLEVTSSHQIKIKMDQIYDGLDNYDAVVIPGGMPGASNLRDDSRVPCCFDIRATNSFSTFLPSSFSLMCCNCTTP